MSLESVLEKCTILSDEHKQGVIKDLEKKTQKFERLIKTFFNDEQNMKFWKIFANNHDNLITASEAKNNYFERNKSHYIKEYLTILCDYYDLEGK